MPRNMTGNGGSLTLDGDLTQIVEDTRAEWEALRNSRIFVTGGTGFIGCWLIDSFAKARATLGLKADMVVLSRYPDKFAAREPRLAGLPGVSFIKGDVRSFECPNRKFTHIIHAATAASAQLNSNDPITMLDTITVGARRIFDFAAECGASVVLQTSSGAVYGRQPNGIEGIPEEFVGAPDCFDPWSAYGEGKRCSELFGAVYSKQCGFEHKVARIFALVGPRLPLNIHYAMGNFIRDGLNGGPIRIGGDGTPYRSYLYVSDMVTWLWKILVNGKSNRPYNVGSNVGISISDTASAVNRAFGNSYSILVAGKAMPGQPGSRYVPNVERICKELGVVARVDLEDGIRRTVLWYRNCGTRAL